MSRPGYAFNRQELLRAIWGDSAFRDPRAIDVHIRHLREKLEPLPEEPNLILTVPGTGYRFRDVMRRRLPAGLRWRLLLALLGHERRHARRHRARRAAADAGPAARPERREPRGLGQRGAAEVPGRLLQLDAGKAPSQYDDDFVGWQDATSSELFAPSNDLTPQSNARVMVLDDTLLPGDAGQGPPGFLYDSEFTPQPAARA